MGFQSLPAQLAGDFAREAGVRRGSESCVGQRSPQRRRRQRQRDLGGADIRRFLNDLPDRQRTVGVRVDRVRRWSACPVQSHNRIGRIFPLYADAIVNGFSVEPGSKTSVSARLRIRLRHAVARIRVVRRPVGERQDLAACASRITSPPALARFASTSLSSAEREAGASSRSRARDRVHLRRANRLDVLDDLAATVDDHAAAARLAAEPLLLRELDPSCPTSRSPVKPRRAHRVAAGIEARYSV